MSRVAVSHQFIAGPRAQKPDGSRHIRQFVGEHILAQQRFGDAGAGDVGNPAYLRCGRPRPLADENGHLFAGVDDVGGTTDRGVVGDEARCAVVGLRRGQLLELVAGCCVGLFLQVGGNDDRRRCPTCHSGAARSVERVGQLGGDVGLHQIITGHVLVQRLEVDLRLVGAPYRAGAV